MVPTLWPRLSKSARSSAATAVVTKIIIASIVFILSLHLPTSRSSRTAVSLGHGCSCPSSHGLATSTSARPSQLYPRQHSHGLVEPILDAVENLPQHPD